MCSVSGWDNEQIDICYFYSKQTTIFVSSKYFHIHHFSPSSNEVSDNPKYLHSYLFHLRLVSKLDLSATKYI